MSTEIINTSGKVGIDVMMKFGQKELNEKGMPEDWKTSVMMPIYMGKGYMTNCRAYRGVKILEHAKKIVEKVLEKRIRVLVEVDDMQFGFMPGRGTTDALFILRSMQKEYREKDKKIVHVFRRFKKDLLIEFQKE